MLELRVYAPATSVHGAHAVWLDPYITRPRDSRSPETKPTAKPPPEDPGLERKTEPVFLTDLPEEKPGPFPSPLWHFGKDGDSGDGSKIKVNGKEWPKALGMHPPGGETSCKVRYRLDARAVSLEATVAISEGAWSPASDVFFEVYADGQRLWKSGPINRGRTEACKVSLQGVRMLELRTKCGAPTGCHAVWLDPFVRMAKAAPPDKSERH